MYLEMDDVCFCFRSRNLRFWPLESEARHLISIQVARLAYDLFQFDLTIPDHPWSSQGMRTSSSCQTVWYFQLGPPVLKYKSVRDNFITIYFKMFT